jgi:hypothetical protein
MKPSFGLLSKLGQARLRLELGLVRANIDTSTL